VGGRLPGAKFGVPKAGPRFAPDHLGLARTLCSSTKALAASVEPSARRPVYKY